MVILLILFVFNVECLYSGSYPNFSEKYLSLVSCSCSSFSCLCCQNIYLSNITFVYFQLTINYYVDGGGFVSFKYHIQSPVLYMMWHLSLTLLKIDFSVMVYCNLLNIM